MAVRTEVPHSKRARPRSKSAPNKRLCSPIIDRNTSCQSPQDVGPADIEPDDVVSEKSCSSADESPEYCHEVAPIDMITFNDFCLYTKTCSKQEKLEEMAAFDRALAIRPTKTIDKKRSSKATVNKPSSRVIERTRISDSSYTSFPSQWIVPSNAEDFDPTHPMMAGVKRLERSSVELLPHEFERMQIEGSFIVDRTRAGWWWIPSPLRKCLSAVRD